MSKRLEGNPAPIDISRDEILAYVEDPRRIDAAPILEGIGNVSKAQKATELKPKEYFTEVIQSAKAPVRYREKARAVIQTVGALNLRRDVSKGYTRRINELNKEVEGILSDTDFQLERQNVSAVIDRLREARQRPEVDELYQRVIINAGKNKKLADELRAQRDMPVEDLYLATVPEPFAPYPTRLPKDAPVFTRQGSVLAEVVAQSALALMGQPKRPDQRTEIVLTGPKKPVHAPEVINNRFIHGAPLTPELYDQLRIPLPDSRVVHDAYKLLGLGAKLDDLKDPKIREALQTLGRVVQRTHLLPPFNKEVNTSDVSDYEFSNPKFRKMLTDFKEGDQPTRLAPVHLLQATFTFSGDLGQGEYFRAPSVSVRVESVPPKKEVPPKPERVLARETAIYDPGAK